MLREPIVLTDEELLEILEHRIPDLLDRHPELKWRIYSAFLDMFARREEIAAIMNELRALREDFQARSDQIEHRLDQLAEEFGQFREETRTKFEQIDQRFEQIDQRFEQIDRRFEQIDQRFEQIDQRFEQIDQRFEQVGRQFEGIGERFRQVDSRFDALTQEMRERFAKMDRQYEELKDWKDWIDLNTGRLQVRMGRRLEEIVAGALRYALKRPDIQPESIRLRQKIVDTEGYVFPKGKQKEVDILASDSEYLVFEVKSAAEPEDVDDFADKVELVRKLYPDKNVRGVFMTLAYEADVEEACRKRGIELIGKRLED